MSIFGPDSHCVSNSNQRIISIPIDFSFLSKEKCCYFVVDFLAGGDLLHALSKFRKISENACKHIAAEILLGLKGLHDKKYIYRDLKIENVLIDAEGHAHICDFGLAKKVDDINAPNYSLCGTPE